MKALVISEDKELVKFYTDIFNENKIDVINYNWLLKAMDNVEEIKPDFIVVSSVEYPRHWKTLVQYVKSVIFIGPTFFILQVSNNFSDDERKKAECLGINEIVSSFSDYFKKKIIARICEFAEGADDDGTDEATTIEVPQSEPTDSAQNDAAPSEETQSEELKSDATQPEAAENEATEVKSTELESAEPEPVQASDDGLLSVDMIVNKSKKKTVECPGSYLLTNPVTGKVIYGKYLEYDGRKITCKVDNPEDFSGIESKSFIKYITYCNKKECKSFSANVNEYIDLSEQKFLVLDICDFYEEK